MDMHNWLRRIKVRRRAHPALLVGLSSEYDTSLHFGPTIVLCESQIFLMLFSALWSALLTYLILVLLWIHFSYITDASGDYIDIKTDKWSSGGYRMDCMDKGSHTGWQCWASCSPFANPNFMDWGYLTFEVRVSGVFDDVCKPSISITKRWPSYGSNVVALGEWKTLKLLNCDCIFGCGCKCT